MKEPGVNIIVKSEGVIRVPPFSLNRGMIIGTANKGVVAVSNGVTKISQNDINAYADYSSLERDFGTYDALTGNELTLMRGADLFFGAGGNYLYAIRITDGNESSGSAMVRYKDGSNYLNCMKVWAKEPGSYSQDISIKIESSANSPIEITERFTIGEYGQTGYALSFAPTSGNSLLGYEVTGDSYTTCYYYVKKNELGEPDPNGDIDPASKTQLMVHYLASGDSWSGGADTDIAIWYDVSPDNTSNFRLMPGSSLTGDTYVIEMTYYYDAIDMTVKWNKITEHYKDLNYLGHIASTINSKSELIYITNPTGGSTFPYDSGTSTMPMPFGWTNLSAGNDGKNVDFNDYRKAFELVREMDWDYLMLPGCTDSRIQSRAVSEMTTAENKNYEHKVILGHDTGESAGKVLARTDLIRDDRAIFVTPGIVMSNRYTGNFETGSATYTACVIAGNIASRSVSTSILGKSLQGIEGIEKEWNSAERERFLDNGIMSIMKQNGYKVNRAITTSETSDFLRITTRNIVDYARKGIRYIGRQFIGENNNEGIRGAMKAAIDAFLKSMERAGHLRQFKPCSVSATDDEIITGEVSVEVELLPQYEIEYINVVVRLG